MFAVVALAGAGAAEIGSTTATGERDAKRIERYRRDLRFGPPKVRAYAAFKLGMLDDRDSVSLLIPALRDRDARVRADVAAALGELGEPAAMAALTEALKDEDSKVRLAAAKAMAKLGRGVTVPVLLEMLRDENAEVRRYAVEALGERADPAAREALDYAAQNDEDTAVRLAAREAAKKLPPLPSP